MLYCRLKLSSGIHAGVEAVQRWKLNKRFILMFGVLLLISCLVTACSQEKFLEVVEEVPTGTLSTTRPIRTKIRWFVGLGTGTDPVQMEIQEAVVASFNASQDAIELILEISPIETAAQELFAQFAAGNAPDIIGPISMGNSNAFHGQWLDLTPFIEAANYDTSVFNPSHLRFYNTDEGLVALPFGVYPTGLYYQRSMFDEAGLNYPPININDPYIWVDGSEVEWDWNTLAAVARMLTKDANGRRATEAGFMADAIVQAGYHPQWSHPNVVGSFWSPGRIYDTETLTATASIPNPWKDAWHWWFDGMWGEQPFIVNGTLAATSEFGGGNLFNSGRVAMSLTQLWYTCCLQEAGVNWDIAALPSTDGVVYGRMDEISFRISKSTSHPQAAFEVLTYLISTEGSQLLLVGNNAHPGGAYNALPALPELQPAYLEMLAAQYPHVENWDIFLQSLNYPDIPSAESWMPNFEEAWGRIGDFQTLIETDSQINLDAEIDILEDDLEIIFTQP